MDLVDLVDRVDGGNRVDGVSVAGCVNWFGGHIFTMITIRVIDESTFNFRRHWESVCFERGKVSRRG